jgi:hemolysin activation/secretion protein
MAERGWLMRNDIGLPLGDSGQELYAGLDYGQVGGPTADLLVGKRLTGAVIGLRGDINGVSYDIFAGQALRKPDGFQTAKVTAGFNLSLSF